MKDTYNLLADGIVKLLRALAAVANTTLPAWAEAQRYQRYLGSSIKGEAAIDWSDRKARAALLAELGVCPRISFQRLIASCFDPILE